MQEAQVAQECDRRRVGAACHPERGGHEPIDAVHAPVGVEHHALACGGEALDVAHRHAGRDHEHGVGGSAGDDVTRDPPLERHRPSVEELIDGGARGGIGIVPGLHPVLVDDHVDGVGERAQQQFGIGGHAATRRVQRIEPRTVRIDQHLIDRGVEPLPGDLAGRRATDPQDDVGAIRVGESGNAQQRVVAGDRSRHPQVREGVGEHRPPRGLGEAERGRRPHAGAPPGHHQAPRTVGHEMGEGVEHLDRRCTCSRHVRGPRPIVRPTDRLDQLLAGGNQRLTEREVEMHRPRGGTERLRRSPSRERAPLGRDTGAIVGHAGLVKPTHRIAVQLHLVDGLAHAGVAQFGRAIGGAHDQRDATVVRLQHRRVKVRRGRSRGGQHQGWTTGRACDAEGEERSGAFVEVHVEPDPFVGRERQRERGRARSRRQARVGDAVARPFVDERAGEGGRRVAGHGKMPP